MVSGQGLQRRCSGLSGDSRCSKVSAITYIYESEEAETEDPLQTWKLTFTDAVLEGAYLVRELTASALSLYGQCLVLL